MRDLAEQIHRTLRVDIDGHEALHCHASNNYLGVDTTDLFEAAFGDLPEPCSLSGEESAFSMAKSRELLGWSPEHTWRSNEPADGPTFHAP